MIAVLRELPEVKNVSVNVSSQIVAHAVQRGVKLLPNGPPVTYPVEFRVTGDDPIKLRAEANRFIDVMRKSSLVYGVKDN